MDAIFGLPLKKSAGISFRDHLLDGLFFSDQFSVDEFVAFYGNSKPISSVSS